MSPPHLALFLGGLLVSSTGIRSMWAKRDIAPECAQYLPALLSGILFIAMVNFITMYLSAWMTNVAPTQAFVDDLKRFPDVMSNQHIGLFRGAARLRRQPVPVPLLHGRAVAGLDRDLDDRAARPDAADPAPLARAGLDLHDHFLAFGLLMNIMTPIGTPGP